MKEYFLTWNHNECDPMDPAMCYKVVPEINRVFFNDRMARVVVEEGQVILEVIKHNKMNNDSGSFELVKLKMDPKMKTKIVDFFNREGKTFAEQSVEDWKSSQILIEMGYT